MKNVTEHEKGTITQNEGLIILTYYFCLQHFHFLVMLDMKMILSTKEFIFSNLLPPSIYNCFMPINSQKQSTFVFNNVLDLYRMCSRFKKLCADSCPCMIYQIEKSVDKIKRKYAQNYSRNGTIFIFHICFYKNNPTKTMQG